MAKLIDVMVSALGFMGKLSSGFIISTGSPTSLVDTAMVANNDDFTGGTLILVGATGGVTSHTVTGYNSLTKTFTFSPASIYMVAGQSYAVTNMGRNALVNAINSALLSMGEYTAMVDAAITSDIYGNFELPVGVNNVRRIQAQNSSLLIDYPNLGTLRRYQYHDWHVAKIGTKFAIVFDGAQVINAPVAFRIWYSASHPRVTLDADEIMPDYHLERLAWETAYWAYFQYIAQDNNASDKNTLIFQTIMESKRALANRYPVPHLFKDPILPRN